MPGGTSTPPGQVRLDLGIPSARQRVLSPERATAARAFWPLQARGVMPRRRLPKGKILQGGASGGPDSAGTSHDGPASPVPDPIPRRLVIARSVGAFRLDFRAFSVGQAQLIPLFAGFFATLCLTLFAVGKCLVDQRIASGVGDSRRGCMGFTLTHPT
jgi:hypothetical protein